MWEALWTSLKTLLSRSPGDRVSPDMEIGYRDMKAAVETKYDIVSY